MDELVKKNEEQMAKSIQEMGKIEKEWRRREVESSRQLKGCEEEIKIHGRHNINEMK